MAENEGKGMKRREEQVMSRRALMANGLAAAAVAGMAPTIDAASAWFGPSREKPRNRFSLDPFEVQKEGPIVYNYGTHTKSVSPERVRDWFNLAGHNFAGCRDYAIGEEKMARDDVRKHWESRNVIPVYMTGAVPGDGTAKIRKGWEEGVAKGYRAVSIDEFYCYPYTPPEYDQELENFKKANPGIYVQVWEANYPRARDRIAFPHLERLLPFVDAYMPEIYWKWYRDDTIRRGLFRELIGRAKKLGALKKLVIGLGTHDALHVEKSIDDIAAILDMEPAIGGFAFFVHLPSRGDAYNTLYAKMDNRLRALFAP